MAATADEAKESLTLDLMQLVAASEMKPETKGEDPKNTDEKITR